MKDQRGKLDGELPREGFGARFAHFTLLELAFWVIIGLVWLAIDGGVVGLVIAAVVAIVVGFMWRDAAHGAKNSIQESESKSD